LEHAPGAGRRHGSERVGCHGLVRHFYLGDRVFHLDRALIQTLMYLKLSVAGHFKFSLPARVDRSGPSGPRGFCWSWYLAHNRGDASGGLWRVHAADRLGLGRDGVGLLFIVVPRK